MSSDPVTSDRRGENPHGDTRFSRLLHRVHDKLGGHSSRRVESDRK